MRWPLHIFGKRANLIEHQPPRLFFTNSLSGKKELFISIQPGLVTLYTCGPTVYSHQHIGNLRSSVFSDILARTLVQTGYRVHRVINITDVGHLVGDADSGDDKVAVSAKKEGLSVHAIAERYTTMFINDLTELNIDTKNIQFPRATEFIKEQISLAKILKEKGYAYLIRDGLYFDTSRFHNYGMLGNLHDATLKEGARVAITKGKRHATDFALWRIAKPNDLQQWNSPWGSGNPGWHLECSAMIRSLLGPEIDIHTGGEDLIAIHHNNEIAQSEAATDRPFVHYWMHNAFLTMDGVKISKSLGNFVYLSDVVEKGFHPLSLRYFFLQAHYRTPVSFSWSTLSAAANTLERLWNLSRDIAEESECRGVPSEARRRFLIAMGDDLMTPQALGILWESLRSEEYTPEEKWGLIEAADAHLGLTLTAPPLTRNIREIDLPPEVREMLIRREAARASGDFIEADRIRDDMRHSGYHVDDGPKGPVLTRTAL